MTDTKVESQMRIGQGPRLGLIIIMMIIMIIKTLFKEEAQLVLHPIFPGVLIEVYIPLESILICISLL